MPADPRQNASGCHIPRAADRPLRTRKRTRAAPFPAAGDIRCVGRANRVGRRGSFACRCSGCARRDAGRVSHLVAGSVAWRGVGGIPGYTLSAPPAAGRVGGRVDRRRLLPDGRGRVGGGVFLVHRAAGVLLAGRSGRAERARAGAAARGIRQVSSGGRYANRCSATRQRSLRCRIRPGSPCRAFERSR